MKDYKTEYSETTNNRVFTIAKKHVYESDCKINCAYCGYHSGENQTNNTWGKPQSWKQNRKTQYKNINEI